MRPDDYNPLRPIPLSERLPKPFDPSCTRPQDCDPMERCWCACVLSEGRWNLTRRTDALNSRFITHWLPYWTLPLPEVES